MIWQDVVLSVGGFVLALGLLPLLRAPVPPPIKSSLTMAGVLTAYIVAVGTLGLYLSAASLGLQTVAWYALAWRGWRS